ncbi:zona pellucida-like domain protein, partial [Ancylostoma caninum]
VNATLAKDKPSPSRFDNSVVEKNPNSGTPVISCERDRIRVEIATTRPFAGKVFVKGEYANRDCVRSYIDGVPVTRRATEASHHATPAQTPLPESEGEATPSSVENAESKDDETHLDSSLWVTSEEDESQELPLPTPEQASRFTNADEFLTINQPNSAEIDFEKLKNSGQLASSKWSGYGGVSSTDGNRPPTEYLGVFSGSRGESTGNSLQSVLPSAHPDLKVYQKSGKFGQEDLLSLQYPGPQGFVSENCPVKCEPCMCPTGKEPQERKRRNTNNVELSVPLGACNAKRDRKLLPPSLVVSFVAVISFHESFITKLDRAYHIQCAYTESNRSISTQMDVGTAAPTDLNGTASVPVCGYHISSAEGKTIQNVRVGDKVKHEWTCKTPVPKMYSMLVHSCFVEDGAGQRYEVIDEYGCSLDRYILSTPSYSADGLTANVDAFMMKFPDKSSVDFQCAIKVCSKLDTNCTAATPPQCSSFQTPRRKRRDVPLDDESMTIHANSLTVLDADVPHDLPEHMAQVQPDTFPTEFCFSVAGFGVLVSASTFLTTIALGTAAANIYMRSQSKW